VDQKNEGMTLTWAVGDSASIRLSLPKTQVRLTANVKSIFGVGKQSVTVKVDGKEVGGWKNTKWSEWERKSVMINPDPNRPSVSNVEFIFSQYLKPTVEEYRRLALEFESIVLE
jgi:hypothetical protein